MTWEEEGFEQVAPARRVPAEGGRVEPDRVTDSGEASSLEVVTHPATRSAHPGSRVPSPESSIPPHRLWGGRFTDTAAPALEALNRSIGVDFRLWPFDVQLSQAWAVALWSAGVLTLEESRMIEGGL